MTEKRILLTPDVFRVNDKGEVIINDSQILEQIKKASDDSMLIEQGIRLSIGDV